MKKISIFLVISIVALLIGINHSDAAAKKKCKGKKCFSIVQQTSVDHDFMIKDEFGNPLKWDFCKPMYFKTNTLYDEKKIKDAVEFSIKELSFHINKEIVDAGTIEIPELYDIRNPTVEENTIYIVFANKETSSILQSNNPGWAQIFTDTVPPTKIYAAKIIIDTEYFKKNNWAFFEKIILHELGHAMNLAHVEDHNQIMGTGKFHILNKSKNFGLGDIKGLKKISERVC
jgi:hypothetical protein